MENHSLLVKQNIRNLHTLHQLIMPLTADEYTAVDPLRFSSSIGAHTRHILDHYLVFLSGVNECCINYDQRLRDQKIENHTALAQAAIERICGAMSSLPSSSMPVQVAESVTVNEAAPAQTSTVGRELVFLHNHATHHRSLIVMIMRIMGKQVTHGVEYAPSTLKHFRETACAR